MKDTFASDALIEDITALIDEALADPARAGRLKAEVRQRLATRPGTESPAPAEDLAEGDGEDLWDNVPL
ncbi:MAG: hypothetical protein MUF63_14680 [Rhodobacteraceae bacterium]|nr:hypothetical protein [Paracoccaceae bacterium]